MDPKSDIKRLRRLTVGDSQDSKQNSTITIVAIICQTFYSTVGLILGTVVIASGVYLTTTGIRGTSSITFSILKIGNADIDTTLPGVVLFIVGLFIVVVTNLSITLYKKLKK